MRKRNQRKEKLMKSLLIPIWQSNPEEKGAVTEDDRIPDYFLMPWVKDKHISINEYTLLPLPPL